jgi:CubicO group peptidase (beta-lactamase class C family)
MKRLTRLAAVLALVPFTSAAWAEPLPRAQPADVGLSAERLDRVSRVLRDEIEKGKVPGAVALVARKGRIAYYESFGVRDPATGAPMSTDAIFRIAGGTSRLGR